MSTLSDPTVMNNFARECVETYRNWQTDTPAMHESRIEGLLNQATRTAALPDFAVSFQDMGDRGGELRFSQWHLAINSRHTRRHDLPAYLFKWFCGIIYHESRHGEQWLRCAQGVLAGDFDLPAAADRRNLSVATAMNIPAYVVEYARATERRYRELAQSAAFSHTGPWVVPFRVW